MESFTSVGWVCSFFVMEVDGILENVPNSSHVSHFAVGSSARVCIQCFYDKNKLTDTKYYNLM